jgi:arabinofuranosyltransferase
MEPEAPRRTQLAIGAAIAFFLLVLVRTAWVAEDAFINFRTIDNFLHGYGLRWNIAERVQTFTDPLWVLIMAEASAVTGEFYYTVLVLSVLLTIATLLVCIRLTDHGYAAAAGIVLLATSKAFVDFSTSGLEGPLVHALLAGFLFVYWKRPPGARTVGELALLAALGAVTRLDTVVITAPVLLVAAARVGPAAAIRPLVLGGLPLVAWELFAVIYYGFPFPNTAYAKLGGGIPQAERTAQGVAYLLDSINRDPVTLAIIATAIVAPALSRDRRDWPVAAGLLLTLVYTVAIGGDFMSGRFLTGALLCGVMLLTRKMTLSVPPALAPLPIALALVMSGSTHDAIFATDGRLREEFLDRDRVGDERRVQYPFTGLMSVSREGAGLTHPWAQYGREVLAGHQRLVEWAEDGIFGFTVGPNVHVVDFFGLGDAFLARLPAERKWYPGHLMRSVPPGYVDTLRFENNRLQDPSLAEYFEQIRVVTRDPLWSRHRLRTIWRLNTGSSDHLILQSAYVTQNRSAGRTW